MSKISDLEAHVAAINRQVGNLVRRMEMLEHPAYSPEVLEADEVVQCPGPRSWTEPRQTTTEAWHRVAADEPSAEAQLYAIDRVHKKISQDELRTLFGDSIPIEVVVLLNPDTNPEQMTLSKTRARIWDIADKLSKAKDVEADDHWQHATAEEVLKGIWEWQRSTDDDLWGMGEGLYNRICVLMEGAD